MATKPTTKLNTRQPQKFLFINKDLTSASLSNDRADSATFFKIGQHVQSVRTLANRRRRPIPRSTTGLVGWASKPEGQVPRISEDTQLSTDRTLVTIVALGEHCSICQDSTPCAHSPPAHINSPPENGLDPFLCSAVPVNHSNQRILQYFASAWIPPGSDIGSNLASFTIMGPHDNDLSLRIVKGSLTTKVHMLSLLAAAASRMKYISKVSFSHSDAPELHTVRAIQALRKYVEANEPVTDRVILDLFFLSLAEYYTKNHLGSRVHYQIMKQFVIKLGGFANMEPFIAWLVLSADHLLAASTVTPPVFDFTRDSRLLGIPLLTTADRVETAIVRSILHLEPKMQILIKDNITLAQVVAYVRQLPDPAQKSITALVDQHSAVVYRIITLPLQVRGPQTEAQLAHARLADMLVSRSRHLAYVLWLWYSALGFARQATAFAATSLPQATALMVSCAAELRANMEHAQRTLQRTACAVRAELLLWLNALGVLVTPVGDDVGFYLRGCVRAAQDMGIFGYAQLVGALAAQLPLVHVAEGALDTLYRLLITEQIFAMEDQMEKDVGISEQRGDTP